MTEGLDFCSFTDWCPNFDPYRYPCGKPNQKIDEAGTVWLIPSPNGRHTYPWPLVCHIIFLIFPFRFPEPMRILLYHCKTRSEAIESYNSNYSLQQVDISIAYRTAGWSCFSSFASSPQEIGWSHLIPTRWCPLVMPHCIYYNIWYIIKLYMYGYIYIIYIYLFIIVIYIYVLHLIKPILQMISIFANHLPTRCFWWPRKCLGRPGLMAIGSAHAFIWPQPANISRAVGRPRLRVEFQKHKADWDHGDFNEGFRSLKRPVNGM
jgi:hypothetical protein